MPFDPTGQTLDFPEQFGFREDALGNLSSSWTIVQGTAAQIQVKNDGIKIAWFPTAGGAGSVTAIYNARASSTRSFRLSASLRFVTTPTGAAVAMGAWIESQITGFSFEFRKYAGLLHSDAPTRVRFITPDEDRSFNQTLVANTWYRCGIEIIGSRIRLLFNPSGSGTATAVSNDASLQIFDEYLLSDRARRRMFHGVSLSANAQADNDYTGVADVRFTTLREDESTGLGGGTGTFGGFRTPYTHYKSVRQVAHLLNNVSLLP